MWFYGSGGRSHFGTTYGTEFPQWAADAAARALTAIRSQNHCSVLSPARCTQKIHNQIVNEAMKSSGPNTSPTRSGWFHPPGARAPSHYLYRLKQFPSFPFKPPCFILSNWSWCTHHSHSLPIYSWNISIFPRCVLLAWHGRATPRGFFLGPLPAR